jgi:tricorn protease
MSSFPKWIVALGVMVGHTAGVGAFQPRTEPEAGDRRPHAGMLRYPDVSQKQIVFVYANDLWLVPREGGPATPLAGPPGPEIFPRFSPDGRFIAFVGNYDGNRDLYTIPVDGGVPHRVTYHPADEVLCDWTPGNRLLFFSNSLAGLARQTQLYLVAPEGGLPEKLPVPYGANGTVNINGDQLAYTPYTIDHRTWKRYRGGWATDIWLFGLKDLKSKKITDWEGTDSQPMWHGSTVYYMSDAGPEHRLNIWSYETGGNNRRQVTRHADHDVKWPAIGPGPAGRGEIVYQLGPDLMLLDLVTGQTKSVAISVPGDRTTVRPREADVSHAIQNSGISATGKRAVLQARGDVWTVPAKHGSPVNLTRTSGVAERDPAWSPDGKSVAYFSDASGEYELYIASADGKGEARKVTSNGTCFRFSPTWSPDSKHIAFTDKTGASFLLAVESGETKLIEQDLYAQPGRMSWSHDSAYIAYTRSGPNRLNSIWLYHVPTGEKHAVTAGRFNDSWPTFDREGKYLAFASNRKFADPAYAEIDTTFIYNRTDLLMLLPLRAEVGSPWAPKSDDEGAEEKKKDDEEKKDEKKAAGGDGKEKDEKGGETKNGDEKPVEGEKKGDEKKDEEKKEEEKKEEKKIEPLVLERERMEQRVILVPVERGGFTNLAFNHEGKLLYLRQPAPGTDGKSSLKLLDFADEEKKEKSVVDEADGFALSADGKKLLVRKDETMAIVDAAPDQKLDKPLPLAGLKQTVDPKAEWRQMFLEAWRIKRDYFYDPNMHGVDWKKIRAQYEPMLHDCASREDLSFVIGEMISELNVGHAYVRGDGDVEAQPKVSVGLLGADFERHEGAYRIKKIHQGAEWDVDARSPLSRPGLNVKEGDYLLAVNGVPIDVTKDPWAAFQGLAGRTVRLTISEKPTQDDAAREVLVEPIDSEVGLRYRSWVEGNRAYVDQKSNGKVGYVHVPNTGVDGQNELYRQFFGQIDKEALIVDERWNGGGQIPTRFIELLNRPVTNYWAVRDGKDWLWPPDSHQGPKCMLINGSAGSGGDCFPYYFKKSRIGKTIGLRTWGGLVGISGNPGLIDGGQTWAPTFAFYETDGTWGVEGHGVDPDIEVMDDPALMVDGGDPQLDKAIEHMLQELQSNPYKPAPRPAYPDRRGMGIKQEDK